MPRDLNLRRAKSRSGIHAAAREFQQRARTVVSRVVYRDMIRGRNMVDLVYADGKRETRYVQNWELDDAKWQA